MRFAMTTLMTASLCLVPMWDAAGGQPGSVIARADGTRSRRASTPSGRPTLPSVFLDASLESAPRSVISVQSKNAAGAEGLEKALEKARPGDVIELEAGESYIGNFVLPKKDLEPGETGSPWITIRSSASSELPPRGTRVTPADAKHMPKIMTPNSESAIRTAPGAHHYKLVGIEVTVTPEVERQYNLVALGSGDASAQNTPESIPFELVIDRCYIHGNATGNIRRGIALNSASTSITDSRVSNIHEEGADSQAICGWNGPGPFTIVNNHLEGAGENVLFGGADPGVPQLVPSDIEFRSNYCTKPLSWRQGDPSYAGKHWQVKNLFELKNARRVLIDGNMFENNWGDAQSGIAILFTPRNQDNSAPWSTVEDVTFTNNIIRHAGGGVNLLGYDNLASTGSGQLKRVLIENNLFYDISSAWNAQGRLFQILDRTADVTINHNTGLQTGSIIVADGGPNIRFVYTNNLTAHGDYGVFGGGVGEGIPALATYFPGSVFTKNVIIGGDPAYPPARFYPPGNFFPASLGEVKFADVEGGDFRLLRKSDFSKLATDGSDIGCDIDALKSARRAGRTPA